MDAEQQTRRRLLAAIVLVPIVLVAALWLPRWWEGRELRQAREIAGVGSRAPGGQHDRRAQEDRPRNDRREGRQAAIGKASFAVGTEGQDSRHEIWTYYFTDGTLTINLTDGAVARVSTIYGTPRIPKKGGGF